MGGSGCGEFEQRRAERELATLNSHHGREDPMFPASGVPPGVIREATVIKVTTVKAVYEQKRTIHG